MLANFSKRRALLLAAWSLIFCANSHAQNAVPYQEVHTIADATHAVPVEHSFNVTTAGSYLVKVVDLGASLTPSAPLASLKFAVTQGNGIVGAPVTIESPQSTSQATSGNLQFNATAGTYTIHVIGAPGTVAGSGPIGIQVTTVGGTPTTVASFSDTLALPSTAIPSNEAVLDGTFTVGTTGSYLVTLTDLQLPQALTTLTLIITTVDGTVVTNTPLPAAGSATVSLQQGVTYRIFAVGQADSTVGAGLYSAVVAQSGGGVTVYSNVIPVGSVSAVQNVSLNAGASYTLSLADLAVPSALASARAVATLNGQVVANLTTPGNSPAFTASSTTLQVFVLASTPATGSYALAVTPSSGPAALSIARAVSVPGGTWSAYSFDAANNITGGSYNFRLTDFAVPIALTGLNGAVVQGGHVVGAPLTAAGTQAVTMADGPASFLVFAQSQAAGGLFDVDLTPSVGGAAVFEMTQGVGQPFVQRQLSITSQGSYAVDVADLGFPTPLTTFAVVATQGPNQLGLVYGAGAFTFTAGTPGTYFINFIAQPGGADGAGTYSLSVAAAPVVNLQSSTTAVDSGGTVTLRWSSTNTDSCTASGGWSGSQPTSGTATSAAITSATTFTLTCTGEGVNAAQSVTVTVNTPTKSSSGGGGALGELLLLALAAALTVKLWFGGMSQRSHRPC